MRPFANAQPWLKKHLNTLQHRPAVQMFPAGLLLGSGMAAMALLTLGQLPGLGVCALLLAATLPLIRGAEPVTRRRPAPPVRRRREVPLPEALPSTPAADISASPVVMMGEAFLETFEQVPRRVEDIPGVLAMVELSAGTFLMGSEAQDEQAYDHEKPCHEVTVLGFAIGTVVVTRRLYRDIMTEHPEQWRGDKDDDLLPANDVNWFDAIEFCNRLSERQKLIPCYRITGKQVDWQRDANGYRLPTEAEWEYAARAGTTTRWFCGDEATELERYAWFGEGVKAHPHPVGQKEPNPWGLYDMAGNVLEWCWDWYGAYPAEAAVDPVGPATGESRVLRGGAFWVVARNLRSADRRRNGPAVRDDLIGFRVVRRPGRQP